MDVLIHLIIWIFRTLFGEQEPAAKLGPRERYDSDRERSRGPYDYGDGRRPGGGQAKTLAELLEEARRQAEGRTAAPPEPAYTPEPEPAPYIPPPAPYIPPPPAPYIPPPPEPRQVRRKKKRRRVEQPAEAPQYAATPIDADRAAAELVAAAAARPRPARRSADFAVALSNATPEQRVVIGRQAIVLMEIFGPPRCRQAFRRGA